MEINSYRYDEGELRYRLRDWADRQRENMLSFQITGRATGVRGREVGPGGGG